MGLFRRLTNVLRPAHHSRDVRRELQFHLDERVDALVQGGMSSADARLTAQRQLGGLVRQSERTRDAGILEWLDSFAADLRYGLRAMANHRLASVVAIVSIGLGVGANTAIFSLINAVVLRPLPVAHPEELVEITFGERHASFTNPLWEEVRALPALAGSFAFAEADLDLATGGVARRRPTNFVSGGFFPVLGVRPLAGRLLQPADDVRGCASVAVVSEGFWRRELGGAASVVGTTIQLHKHPFEIVGVVPRSFPGIAVGHATDIYAPLCAEATIEDNPTFLDGRSTWFLTVMGRLKPGQDAETASRELSARAPAVFAATLPPDWPKREQDRYLKRTLSAVASPGGYSDIRAAYSTPLYILMAVVAIVLAIACANVAQLLMARAAARQREIAVRLAIGASRWRLFRQLLTEGMLLSLIGACFGVLFAQWAGKLLVRLLGASRGTVFLDTTIDWRLLGFITIVTIVNGIVFGLAPAWRASRISPQSALRSGSQGIIRGEPGQRAGKALVIGQIALALVLVTGAGLLLDSFRRLVAVDPGFRTDGLLVVRAELGATGVPDSLHPALEAQVLDRLRAIPGVQSVATSTIAPLSHMGWNGFVVTDGFTPRDEQDGISWFNAVSPGFFRTYQTPILTGRDFGATDTEKSPRVAIVNQAAVKHFFGGAPPIGKTFREGNGDTPGEPVEVVGVVANTRYQSVDEESEPIVYYPATQAGHFGDQMRISVRSRDALSITPAITAAIAEVHPAISLDFVTMQDQVAASIARPRLLAVLSGFFGGLALLLALIGLYGTIAYSVARRRNEIGIRLALGAHPSQVVGMILREAGTLAGIGLVLGTVLTLAGSRLLAAMLYGTTPTNPATLALSIGVVLAVALSAGAIPAVRAARLDPATALRTDG
ncbi:MAG: ABC transporter permease [Gemmatimonadota bacterium]